MKKNVIFLLLLFETEIVDTRQNRLIEAVLTGTHNLCFIAEIRKIVYTPVNPIFLHKSGVLGVKITKMCFRDAFPHIYCKQNIVLVYNTFMFFH